MKNKLYLLERTDEWSWDDYYEAVVCAPTSKAALNTEIAYSAWTTPENIKITYLGKAAKTIKVGVISTANQGS